MSSSIRCFVHPSDGPPLKELFCFLPHHPMRRHVYRSRPLCSPRSTVCGLRPQDYRRHRQTFAHYTWMQSPISCEPHSVPRLPRRSHASTLVLLNLPLPPGPHVLHAAESNSSSRSPPRKTSCPLVRQTAGGTSADISTCIRVSDADGGFHPPSSHSCATCRSTPLHAAPRRQTQSPRLHSTETRSDGSTSRD